MTSHCRKKRITARMAGTVSGLVLHALLQFLWCPGALGEELFSAADTGKRNAIRKPQGYTIDFLADAKRRNCIVLAGHDAQGTLYAAVTFYQMLEKENSALTVRKVFVKDWPDFRYRINSYFNIVARRTGKGLSNLNHARNYVDWLLKHKIGGFRLILKLVEEDHKHYSMRGDYDPQLDADTLQLRDMWRQEGPR